MLNKSLIEDNGIKDKSYKIMRVSQATHHHVMLDTIHLGIFNA